MKNEQSVVIGGVNFSSPEKTIFEQPHTSKADVAKYYAQAADRMLPYLYGRLLSVVRCPKGADEKCFFKKHPDEHHNSGIGEQIVQKEDKTQTFYYIENEEGLLSEVQMGTLEFHVWGSKVPNIETPDMMVFDLDPDEGMELSKVRECAIDLKSILDRLKLTSFLKTSGGKGYHVVLPFSPSVEWEAFSAFSKKIALIMEKNWPEKYTSNMLLKNRKGKTFVDWVRNSRGATAVSPYSLRARAGAKVSMPISWEEIDKIAPDGVDINMAKKRLREQDPWSDFFETKQEILI